MYKILLERLNKFNAVPIIASYCEPSADFFPVINLGYSLFDIREFAEDYYTKHPRSEVVEISGYSEIAKYLKECFETPEDFLRYGVTCIEYLRSLTNPRPQYDVTLSIDKMRMCLENIYDAYRYVEKEEYYRTISLMSNLRLVIGDNWVTDYIGEIQQMLHKKDPAVLLELFDLGTMFAVDFA